MIVITGAAGFIGSNLAHRLHAEGQDLLLVDHPLVPEKLPNWAGLSSFRFLDHERFLVELPQLKPQAIFHLGACSATTELSWNYLLKNNVQYTQRLWEYSTNNGCPYLYASSAATYGDGTKGFDDATPPAQLVPLNLYGKSKNDFDIWAMEQKQTPPIWAGMKFFNVYGPRENHKGRMASVIRQAHKQIKDKGEVTLFRSNHPQYPDGGQLRDFVFVQDCINHMLWLAKQPGTAGVFNSGTGQPRSFLDLAKSVFAAMNLPPNIRFIDMPTDLAGKYQYYTKAEMAKLKATGYDTPPTTLEDGAKATVAWLETQATKV